MIRGQIWEINLFFVLQKESEELAPLSPFNKMKISLSDGQLSSNLTIPEEKYWVTHVTFVYSTSEIMVQIVGEEYSVSVTEYFIFFVNMF